MPSVEWTVPIPDDAVTPTTNLDPDVAFKVRCVVIVVSHLVVSGRSHTILSLHMYADQLASLPTWIAQMASSDADEQLTGATEIRQLLSGGM